LRKLVYLIIKELSRVASDVMMATSSLIKDMNDKVSAEIGYKSNAIRALCTITDPSMFPSIERFIKQAALDKDKNVSSAALVSALHLFKDPICQPILRKWAPELQELLIKTPCANHKQYLALALLYFSKSNDKGALTRILTNTFKSNTLRSNFAICLVIKVVKNLIDEEGGLSPSNKHLFEVLESYLRHSSDMVNLEAARAITSLKGASSKEIFPALMVLQLFLNSNASATRFAAIRTLSKIASTHSDQLSPLNMDMENLITDQNRSISTFAITTLLKTGNEASVDRLLKQISTFMFEISDEFKVIVVDAIRTLCLKFPGKQSTMLSFLSTALKGDGGYDFKLSVVEGMFDIVQAGSESREIALSHLAEFIEDCDFPRLISRILHLLGEYGPHTSTPSKYIRYIYNRTILENSSVRAAAVSALSKFSNVEDLKDSVNVLLRRCCDDADDEVRDRAVYYLSDEAYESDEMTYKFDVLEKELERYCEAKEISKPFDIEKIPLVSRREEETRVKQEIQTHNMQKAVGIVAEENLATFTDVVVTDKSYLSRFSAYGSLLRSSDFVDLTEADVAEYVVKCIKHMYPDHIVFEAVCRNTLSDILLESVHLVLEPEDKELKSQMQFVSSIPIESLPYEGASSAFLIYKKNGFPLGSFASSLKFVSKDCDQDGNPDPDGYDDVYQMEPLEITIGDYIVQTFVPNFNAAWDEIQNQVVETFLLPMNSIKEALDAISKILQMNFSETLDPSSPTHAVTFSGILLEKKFLGRVRMAFSSGVNVEIRIRCEDDNIAQLICESIG
jgi:coatomer protein complex subunit gamma